MIMGQRGAAGMQPLSFSFSSFIPMAEILRLERITKRYGPIVAVKNVSLTVHRGEILGLVGDNGAGKSTLVKIISGAVIPDSGSIYFDGEIVRFRSPADARRVGIEMVYQDLALCESLNVVQNLLLGREPVTRVLKIPLIRRKEASSIAGKALAYLGINVPSLNSKVRNLSGGQRQAVAIARAVMSEPKLVILDEPTAALAVVEVKRVLSLIRELKNRGIAVILISHRLQDVIEVCDRVVVMYEGSVVAERGRDQITLEEIVRLIAAEKGI